MEELAPGRIVHFVLHTQLGKEVRRAGEVRPAIVVKVYSPEEDHRRGEEVEHLPGTVSLNVFMDGANDGARYQTFPVLWVPSCGYSENHESGTWHWPQRT